jgi:hypothetical protein
VQKKYLNMFHLAVELKVITVVNCVSRHKTAEISDLFTIWQYFALNCVTKSSLLKFHCTITLRHCDSRYSLLQHLEKLIKLISMFLMIVFLFHYDIWGILGVAASKLVQFFKHMFLYMQEPFCHWERREVNSKSYGQEGNQKCLALTFKRIINRWISNLQHSIVDVSLQETYNKS